MKVMQPTSRAARIRTIVGLTIGAAALVAGVAWAALGAAQNSRQGIRVRFATIDSAAAEQGSAFLIVSSRDVSVTGAGQRAECGPMVLVVGTGRITRGTVRSVTLELIASAPGALSLGQAMPCGSPRLRLTLEDGTVLQASRGTIQLTALERRIGGRIAGTFSATAMQAGAPVTVTGSFELRVPRPRPGGVQAVRAAAS